MHVIKVVVILGMRGISQSSVSLQQPKTLLDRDRSRRLSKEPDHIQEAAREMHVNPSLKKERE